MVERYDEIKSVPKIWGEEKWIVNRDYCGKLLIIKKGFGCSLHCHKIKDETFYINKGKVLLEYDGDKYMMYPGDSQLIEPNKYHRFIGIEDSEIMEFSTHHRDDDSYRESASGPVDLSSLELPEE